MQAQVDVTGGLVSRFYEVSLTYAETSNQCQGADSEYPRAELMCEFTWQGDFFN